MTHDTRSDACSNLECKNGFVAFDYQIASDVGIPSQALQVFGHGPVLLFAWFVARICLVVLSE